MSPPDPHSPDRRLRVNLRPWSGTRATLKVWGALLGVMFALTLGALAFALATGSPATLWFKAALGVGVVLALYLLIARFTRLWDRL